MEDLSSMNIGVNVGPMHALFDIVKEFVPVGALYNICVLLSKITASQHRMTQAKTRISKPLIS